MSDKDWYEYLLPDNMKEMRGLSKEDKSEVLKDFKAKIEND